MMCEKCGKPTEQEATLCPECIAAQNASTNKGSTPVQEEPVIDLAKPATSSKPNKKVFIGIAAAVLAIAVIVAAIFIFKDDVKTFDTPQEQLVYVEGEALGEFADSIADVYGQIVNTAEISSGVSGGSTELHVQMGNDIIALVESYIAANGAEMELDWLADIGLGFDFNTQEDLTAFLLSLKLGNNHILGLDTITDLKNGKVYMAIPELNPSYVVTEIEENDISIEQLQQTLSSNQAAIAALAEALPSQQEFGTMLDSYINLILAQLTNVEKTTETVTVGGISQEQTVLVTKLTQADLLNIVVALAEKTKTDETLKGFVSSVQDYANEILAVAGESVESVDLLAQWESGIDSFIAEIKASIEEADAQNYIQLKTYVDKKNNIMGHALTVYSAEEEPFEVFCALSANDKDTTAFQLQVGTVSITGQKSEKKEVSNSTYTLSVDGVDYLTLSCKDVTENAGAVRIVPTEALVDLALENLGIGFTVPGEVALVLEYSVSDSTTNTSIRAEMDQNMLLALILTSSQSNNAEAIQVPGDAIDAANALGLLQWLKDIDISTVKSNLATAGAPSEIVDLLETVGSSLLGQLN